MTKCQVIVIDGATLTPPTFAAAVANGATITAAAVAELRAAVVAIE